MRIALYQPDIAQNAGAVLRLAACLGVAVDMIEPLGFILGDPGLKRAGLDYLERAALRRHRSFSDFLAARRGASARLVLLTTKASESYLDFSFEAADTLLVGRESAGVPEAVHRRADARLKVPMVEGVRSLNVVCALSIVLGEALRQTGELPRSAGAERIAS
ncbi:MAG TPA: tRNA (cytidine(34)-2'-O)-methyltransferase [Alphaproteobacteria bacterium]|nr:tRNA (cytidine(34)-2'-O)-methyltransferase [Alphaproteobacteria bacterium]